MTGLTIGDAAKQTGVKVPTIRYYEQIGLLPVPSRTEGNRRLYTQREIKRLAFIRHARELGFEIDAIRALLTLQDEPTQPCRTADQIARARLDEVKRRIRILKALKAELEVMVEGCRHGEVAECRVIETLSDHGKCVKPHH